MNAPVSEAAVLEPLAGVARQAGAPDLADQLGLAAMPDYFLNFLTNCLY